MFWLGIIVGALLLIGLIIFALFIGMLWLSEDSRMRMHGIRTER